MSHRFCPRTTALALVTSGLCGAATLSCSSDESTSEPVDGGIDAAPPPVTAIAFTEQRRFTIAAEPGHQAFPSVTQLADGQLLLVFRMGADHVEATGRIMKQLGSADASQWSTPEVLFDAQDMDDRDPSAVTLPDGSVLVSYFQYRTQPVGSDTLILHQVFVATSTDGAQTFTPFEQASAGPMEGADASIDGDGLWVDGSDSPIIVTACSSPAVALDGSIAIPTYGGNTLNLGNLAASPRSTIALLESADGAGPWTSRAVAQGAAPDVWLQEPALLLLSNGTWLVQARTAQDNSPSSPGPLVQTSSTDQGATWSAWTPFGFVGHAPDLIELGNGVVLSAFREINDAFTQEWVSFVYSLDHGVTWSAPERVLDCGAVECGYPSLVELDGDRVLMVYYTAGGASIDGVVLGFEATR